MFKYVTLSLVALSSISAFAEGGEEKEAISSVEVSTSDSSGSESSGSASE